MNRPIRQWLWLLGVSLLLWVILAIVVLVAGSLFKDGLSWFIDLIAEGGAISEY